MRLNFTKLLVLGSVFFSLHSSAQLDPYYTHYMLNKLAYNPAVAGEKNAICLNVITHQQWLGQKAQDGIYKPGVGQWNDPVNPATSGFSITAPLLKNQLGVGFQAITDKLGYNTNLYMRGSLAWKFRMGRKLPDGVSTDQTFAIGADFGLAQVRLDGTKYNALDPGDPNIPSTVVSGSKFDAGFGVFYTHQRLFDGFYAGASVTHLTAPVINVGGVMNWSLARYVYVLAGSRHDFGAIAIMPSILAKSSGKFLQLDLGARAMFNEKLVAGANIRTGDAISLMVGYYVLPNLYFGYSYDMTALSEVNEYSRAGTHEIFASFCFDITPPPPTSPKPIFNVRYLQGYTLY